MNHMLSMHKCIRAYALFILMKYFCSMSDFLFYFYSYSMIFVPFTRKDNHGKRVRFAIGLLSSENVESYTWLLSTFKSCMGKSPKLIITDQDPFVKIAMVNVMPETHHRILYAAHYV